MEVTQDEVAGAYRAFYARPHDVVDIAMASEDLQSFANALVEQLGVTEAVADVLVTIPLQRLTKHVRARFSGTD